MSVSPIPARAGISGFWEMPGILASASSYSPRLPGSSDPVALLQISSTATVAGQRRIQTTFPETFPVLSNCYIWGKNNKKSRPESSFFSGAS